MISHFQKYSVLFGIISITHNKIFINQFYANKRKIDLIISSLFLRFLFYVTLQSCERVFIRDKK